MNSPQNIRVVMLIPFIHYQTGGMERQSWQLAGLLKSKNVDVFFISCVRFWELFTKKIKLIDQQNGIKVYRIPGIYLPNSNKYFPLEFILWGTILLWLFRKKYDIIHAHQLFSAGLLGVLAKKVVKKPVISKIAGGGKFGDITDLENYPLSKFKKKLLKKIDCLIAINPEIVKELTKAGFSSSGIKEIPNGVDTDLFKPVSNKPELREKLNLPDNKIVTFVGRIVEQKQLHFLTDIWPKILEKNNNARLMVIGKPDKSSESYFSQIKQKIEESGAKTSISFLGTFSSIKQYLAASDVFVLPSRSEGLSNALLEAASTGLPIIASNIAGNKLVIQSKKNGLLFDPGDPNELLSCLNYLLENNDEAERLGAQARKSVQENFSLKSICQQYILLYQQLLQSQDH